MAILSQAYKTAVDNLDGMSMNELQALAQLARTKSLKKAANELRVGDEVTFDAKKRGLQVGILIRKNKTTYQILVGSVTWKVTPTLLKKVA